MFYRLLFTKSRVYYSLSALYAEINYHEYRRLFLYPRPAILYVLSTWKFLIIIIIFFNG